MRTDEIIRNLNYTIKKHSNDRVFTGQTNISAMCKDILPRMEQLKAYEDAEEQGLLLRLPCKDVYESSGDTVYYIFDYEIAECINCGISIDAEGNIFIHLACDEHIFPYRNLMAGFDTDPTDCCLNTTTVSIDEWGKTVFLTKEEAEQKLESMRGGE